MCIHCCCRLYPADKQANGTCCLSIALSQVCQPWYCASIPPPVKIILQEHTPHQPLHHSHAAPSGRQPENGCLAFPAISFPPFQQDPERPCCSCLRGTSFGCSCNLFDDKRSAVDKTKRPSYILFFTGTGDLCQVCGKPLLCSRSKKRQGIC